MNLEDDPLREDPAYLRAQLANAEAREAAAKAALAVELGANDPEICEFRLLDRKALCRAITTARNDTRLAVQLANRRMFQVRDLTMEKHGLQRQVYDLLAVIAAQEIQLAARGIIR